jgi:hypothetical protein
VDSDGRSEPITDVSLAPLVLQGTGATLPWILLANREVAELSGAPPQSGGTTDVIVLPLNDRLTIRAAIDPASGLVASFELSRREGDGPRMRAVPSDYREVAGIRLPFLEEYLIDGRIAGSFRVTRAIVNPPPDTIVRIPPTGAP